MLLTKFELALWYLSLVLELLVCLLAFRRRFYRQLPVFTAYITVVLLRGLMMYWIYYQIGYASRPALYTFWITQAMLLACRGAVIGEIAWAASRPYHGFRVVITWLVAAIFLTLLILAAWLVIETPSQLPVFVLRLERNLELTTAVVLFILLSLALYYQVMLNSVQKLIAIGLFLYSITQVVNNAISDEWLRPYFRWWGIVRLTSFHLALVIWVIALLQPFAQEPVPDPGDVRPIREFMRQGNELMHDLSARLSRFRRKLQR
jgi:hypothetical protein